jgi:hypothetical protein
MKKKKYSETSCEQERRGIDIELPLQVRAHLSFHLIDLPESKHALAHDTLRLADRPMKGVGDEIARPGSRGSRRRCSGLISQKEK